MKVIKIYNRKSLYARIIVAGPERGINISTRKIRFTERFSRTNVLKSPG